MNQAKQKLESQTARNRFVSAFLDLMIVEKVIRPEDRKEFGGMVAETVDNLIYDMKQTILMEALFGKIFK